jgi:virulence factor
MRIAIIGLGDIAQKAYLPVITTRNDIELVFCTRNQVTLDRLTKMYRVTESVNNIDDLLDKKLDAAFVHTSTESHTDIAGKLLKHGIHVYLDKPIAYSYEESQNLVELAEQTGHILMIGFNRRFAPMYNQLITKEHRQLIIMQKHRVFLPEHARYVVFDDFIHVIDTLLYLAPGKIRDVRVSSLQKGGQTHQVMLQLDGDGYTAIGIMNRDSGMAEEVLEVINPGNKWVVRGLNTTAHYMGGEEHVYHFNDWDSVLYRRGFPQIIDHFLQCVKHNSAPLQSVRDALETHAMCERITTELERDGATDVLSFDSDVPG